MCIRDREAGNPDLRSRAYMYWRLLSVARENSSMVTPEMLKDIVDGELPIIELNTKLDPAVLEELELNIGSITSIYLKPTAQIFRMNTVKHLPQSRVLNNDKQMLRVTEDFSSHESSSSSSKRGAMNSRKTGVHRTPTMNDFDKPAETVNKLKGERKSSSNSPSKLARKPSMLMRKLTLKKKF